MMLQRFHSSSSFLVLAALASGLAALSCGGTERDTVVGPPPSQPLAATDQATVTASATAKQTICHYDKTLDTYSTLSLTASGVAAHIPKHVKDYDGACAATCPCFTRATIDALAATCSGGATAQCPVQYSVQLFCITAPVGGNKGYFEAGLGADTCVWDTVDSTGALVRAEKPVSAPEFAACKDAIVTSEPYPSTGCPS
jgi:hypothetical protein